MLHLVESSKERALRRPSPLSFVRLSNHRLDEVQLFPDKLDTFLETKNAGLKARPLQNLSLLLSAAERDHNHYRVTLPR